MLRQHFEVAKLGYHICHVLGNNDAVPSGLLPSPQPTISAFDAQLNDLHSRLSEGELDPLAELALLRVRLELFSFTLTEDEAAPQTFSAASYTAATPYLAQMSSAAVNLINVVSQKLAGKPWSYMASLAVIYAVNVLVRFLKIKGYHDEVAIRSTISQTWNLLNAKSEFEHDSFSRMCKIIGYLSRTYLEHGDDSALTPASVTSRMAANVMFGNAWKAKSRFSQSVRDSRPRDYTAAAALEELSLPVLAEEIFDMSFFGGFDMETFGAFSEL